MNNKLQLICIKTRDSVFISDNVENKMYFTNQLENLTIEGETLEETYKKGWYKLKNIPEKIYKKIPGEKKNQRYELKQEFPVTEKTPKIISYNDSDEYEDILGLYEYKFEQEDSKLEEVYFEINIISEIDQVFNFEKKEYPVKYDFLTQLNINPVLHELYPCQIEGKDLYNIVRDYIKENINPKYASITSDYDFCLTVKKKAVSSNNLISKSSDYTVFRTSPAGYDSYPKMEGIKGKNYKDLKEKINNYLEDLMQKINEPIKVCECCNGKGIVK